MSILALFLLGIISATEFFLLIRISTLLAKFRERSYVTGSEVLAHMPSVSVCIAARNERHAMTRCIESVLASTYPKMEVLVLDDESVDNTSSLIKAFAHEGVRFIQGDTLPRGWLGRNHAFQTLLRESSGTYVLFLSVDTIMSPHSIAQLVAYAESTDSQMISVLPQRRNVLRADILFSPFRYFWQILGHRVSHPMVASSVWMARRKTIQADFGDLSSVKDSVEPEVDIARHYFTQHAYKFLASRTLLGIQYHKKMSSQIETIVRVRYPELRYSPIITLTSSFVKVLVALAPLMVIVGSYFTVLALIVYVLGALVYRTYLRFVWRHGSIIGMWIWPVILLFDAWLSILSMLRYSTHSVTWKGRRITTHQ